MEKEKLGKETHGQDAIGAALEKAAAAGSLKGQAAIEWSCGRCGAAPRFAPNASRLSPTACTPSMLGQAAIERTPSSAGAFSHGQAAMEYLMTYGWALLVIAVVISMLVLINPFAPPQGCRFDDIGFTCDPPAFADVANNVVLYLNIYNANNNNIRIFALNCTADKTSQPPDIAIPTAFTLVPRQANYTVLAWPCYRNGLPMGSLSPGSDFSGKLWVYYKNEEDPGSYPIRVVSAIISGKVSR